MSTRTMKAVQVANATKSNDRKETQYPLATNDFDRFVQRVDKWLGRKVW